MIFHWKIYHEATIALPVMARHTGIGLSATTCDIIVNAIYIAIYSQTCIKRSHLGQRKKWPYKISDLLEDVQFI